MVGGDLASLDGRYRLVSKIGEGTLGTVYEAEDADARRRVAVKVLGDELVRDAGLAERLMRAARAQTALSHPNIARVFAHGRDGDRYFVVSELVEGEDLEAALANRAAIPAERTVAVAMQVCGALEHAHAAGIAHLDLKPSNVIVTASGSVKVTDFGMVRAALVNPLGATRPGATDYTAPELTTGEGAGPPADVYSLGVIIYRAVTGDVPFEGADPRTVAFRHMRENVAPPSSRAPSVPPALDEVVVRATAKDPDERFDAAGMRAALQTVVDPPDGEGATAAMTPPAAVEKPDGYAVWPIPGRSYDAARLGRRVIAVLVALAVIALGAFLWRITAGTDARDRPRISPPPTPIELTRKTRIDSRERPFGVMRPVMSSHRVTLGSSFGPRVRRAAPARGVPNDCVPTPRRAA